MMTTTVKKCLVLPHVTLMTSDESCLLGSGLFSGWYCHCSSQKVKFLHPCLVSLGSSHNISQLKTTDTHFSFLEAWCLRLWHQCGQVRGLLLDHSYGLLPVSLQVKGRGYFWSFCYKAFIPFTRVTPKVHLPCCVMLKAFRLVMYCLMGQHAWSVSPAVLSLSLGTISCSSEASCCLLTDVEDPFPSSVLVYTWLLSHRLLLQRVFQSVLGFLAFLFGFTRDACSPFLFTACEIKLWKQDTLPGILMFLFWVIRFPRLWFLFFQMKVGLMAILNPWWLCICFTKDVI